MMKRCWHAVPEKRPTMLDVISFFDHQLGNPVGAGESV
jgi:hypothetical protein